jgi:hypothetical protein
VFEVGLVFGERATLQLQGRVRTHSKACHLEQVREPPELAKGEWGPPRFPMNRLPLFDRTS